VLCNTGVTASISSLTVLGTNVNNAVLIDAGNLEMYQCTIRPGINNIISGVRCGSSGGTVRIYESEINGAGDSDTPNFSVGLTTSNGQAYAFNSLIYGKTYGVTTANGSAYLTSGSYYGGISDLYRSEGFAGLLNISGGYWRTSSGSVRMTDNPVNIITVGDRHCNYTTITEALAGNPGTVSGPRIFLVAADTYAESFTVGDYQEVSTVGGERNVIINGTVTINGIRSALRGLRITPTSGNGLVVSGGTPFIFNNTISVTSGSAISVTSGTPTIRGNTFSGGPVYLTGGDVLLTDNFHNSGVATVVNGSTAFIDDWMDSISVTSGTVTLGAKASANTITLSGGTVSGGILDRDSGRLLLPMTGSSAGIQIGSRVWYDDGSNWRTPSSVRIDGTLGVGAAPVSTQGVTVTNNTIAIIATVSDAGTNNSPGMMIWRHQTSATPVSLFGLQFVLQLHSSTNINRSVFVINAYWSDATDASRKAAADFFVYDTDARLVLRMQANGSAPMVGFLGAAAAVRQTSGANLTNNVTAGGTDDTIANYTDLVTYANDAAAIRNDIYQLARKLAQVNNALRTYGLLT
jgi:hypothetical protein